MKKSSKWAAAKSDGASIPGSDLDDDANYLIEVRKPIRVAHTWLRPDQTHVSRGAFIKGLLADPTNSGYINVIKAV